MNEQKAQRIEQEKIDRKEAVNELYRLDLLNLPLGENNYDGYVKVLVEGVISNLEKIDAIISESLVNYTIDRLSYVDRAIIRVATFEMLNGFKKVIAINEAVELTKELTNLDDDKQKAFNNSLLDKISKRIW